MRIRFWHSGRANRSDERPLSEANPTSRGPVDMSAHDPTAVISDAFR